LRIDHPLLSPAVAARLKTAGVDRAVRGWEKASDHQPVWIEVAEGAAERPKPTSRLSSWGDLASKSREQTSTRECKSVGLSPTTLTPSNHGAEGESFDEEHYACPWRRDRGGDILAASGHAD
jgi:hypothetical protein